MHDDAATSERQRLLAAISEARHRLSDLTRELDESMRAEEDETTVTDLQRAQQCVIDLQEALARLDAAQ